MSTTLLFAQFAFILVQFVSLLLMYRQPWNSQKRRLYGKLSDWSCMAALACMLGVFVALGFGN